MCHNGRSGHFTVFAKARVVVVGGGLRKHSVISPIEVDGAVDIRYRPIYDKKAVLPTLAGGRVKA